MRVNTLCGLISASNVSAHSMNKANDLKILLDSVRTEAQSDSYEDADIRREAALEQSRASVASQQQRT